MIRVLLILLPIAVTIYALIDALLAPRAQVRLMSKWIWVLVILLLWFGGALLWFFLGRPRAGKPGLAATAANRSFEGTQSTNSSAPMGPDDDPDFLSSLDNKKPDNGK